VITYLTVALVGFASAFQPFLPAEAYLLGVIATTGAAPVLVGLVSAVGQTAGKVVVFLAARGLVRWSFVRRLIDRPRPPKPPSALRRRMTSLIALLDQPRWSVALLSVSAVAGIPPLIATTVYAARTPMRLPVFAAVTLLGRSVRFVVLALAPGLFMP
jgi:membrane protein YqaA with SNARE-associated domain